MFIDKGRDEKGKPVINNTMLTDYYELTMANGYFECGMAEEIGYFDMFFRKIPDGGGFAIMAGLEQLVNYMNDLHFTDADIEYLRGRGEFSEGFLDYLKHYKFECDVWAVPEGTPVFPHEPLITVRGPLIQAQMLETFLLLTINHQTLIATKTNRIVRAAKGRAIMEFGSRRAQGASAAVLGARAAYIGGAVGTACAIADPMYKIPAMGTMAHSWVQSFDSEYEAFSKFAELYPHNCVLLIDTFDVLKSGLPNAIRVFKEKNPTKKGIRIDSGDITWLSKKCRKILDEEGLNDCSIVASNSFDEYTVRGIVEEGAEVNSFGVGERLITAESQPVFGGVYKLAAIEKDGKIIPKIKVSENTEKITNPGYKKVYRIYDKETRKAQGDVVALSDDVVPSEVPFEIFNPEFVWKRKIISNYEIRELQVPIFEKGNLVYKLPSLNEIRDFCAQEIDLLWDEIKRFENPHGYYVDLSKRLWALKDRLLNEHGKTVEAAEKQNEGVNK